jgi:hypothetical protein
LIAIDKRHAIGPANMSRDLHPLLRQLGGGQIKNTDGPVIACSCQEAAIARPADAIGFALLGLPDLLLAQSRGIKHAYGGILASQGQPFAVWG